MTSTAAHTIPVMQLNLSRLTYNQLHNLVDFLLRRYSACFNAEDPNADNKKLLAAMEKMPADLRQRTSEGSEARDALAFLRINGKTQGHRLSRKQLEDLIHVYGAWDKAMKSVGIELEPVPQERTVKEEPATERSIKNENVEEVDVKIGNLEEKKVKQSKTKNATGKQKKVKKGKKPKKK
ncbi:hypothetical protein OHC33_000670 [Knufia fluminis]|uniref:Uncharacterized protein n=1 Tax=Knufia fluminis TaxID=191047 RepID=A0AAN8EU10_9EURO|nr:hypothetical protein OHC33_000670 [Knufia fluminis]